MCRRAATSVFGVKFRAAVEERLRPADMWRYVSGMSDGGLSPTVWLFEGAPEAVEDELAVFVAQGLTVERGTVTIEW